MTVHRSWKAAMASAGVAMALMLGSGAAQARGDVAWSVGIGVPGVVVGASNYGPVYAAPPVVYAPAPVYRAPPPVYYTPPPVVYAPPVYYAPRPYWEGRRGHWEHRHGHRGWDRD